MKKNYEKSNGSRFKYGAHLSPGKPDYIENLIESCALSAVQIFMSNPRSFNPAFSKKSRENLISLMNKRPELTLYAHMPYVVNLASADISLREKSIEHVIFALRSAADFNTTGYVVHPGSGPYNNFLDSFEKIINVTYDCGVELLIENTEGSGNKLMGNLTQINDFIKHAGRMAQFCWDTAHASGAGIETLNLSHDIKSTIKLIHLNDSKAPFASKIDRHAGFYEGSIGERNIGRIIEFFGAKMTYIIEREGDEVIRKDLLYINKTLKRISINNDIPKINQSKLR